MLIRKIKLLEVKVQSVAWLLNLVNIVYFFGWLMIITMPCALLLAVGQACYFKVASHCWNAWKDKITRWSPKTSNPNPNWNIAFYVHRLEWLWKRHCHSCHMRKSLSRLLQVCVSTCNLDWMDNQLRVKQSRFIFTNDKSFENHCNWYRSFAVCLYPFKILMKLFIDGQSHPRTDI